MNNNYFLTIDVGTKNLAICVSRYKTDNEDDNILNNINIIDWDIIDVSYKPLYCKQIKNKRAICNCISKFYSLIDPTINDHSKTENLIGYCKSHANLIRLYNKKKENKKNQIKLYSIASNPIYKNNFNTQMDKLLIELEYFFNKSILNPYNINYDNNNQYYIKNLDIYIENQPVFKNPIMKSISVGIYTFFSMKKILKPQVINSVNFINATVKTKKDFILKIDKLINTKSIITDFDTYAKRKDFSEDIINQVIHKLPNDKNNLNNIISISKYILRKKKDDLADTLLYILYIIIYLLN